ncbi:MAG: hypothetical protein M1438_00840 [Deltaproteobacteria bacterium]|nr:hypothetical protein [Deltaproteobacteria bacterium]
MLYANLYIDRIELAPYLSPEDCRGAGMANAAQLAAKFKKGALRLDGCPGLSTAKRAALDLALRAEEVLPKVQSLEFPRPLNPSLFELNDPGPDAPLLVTGNSEFTLTVLTGLLSLTVSPFFLLQVDTRGDTADMSMIYRSFTPQRLDQALETQKLAERLSHRELIIPGVLAPMKEELAGYLASWTIRPGPICAAELPLFLGDKWQALP